MSKTYLKLNGLFTFLEQNVAQSNLSTCSMFSDLLQWKSSAALARKNRVRCRFSYRWVEGGVGLCADLDEKLEQLFNRFVAVYDAEKGDSRSDRKFGSSSVTLVQRGLSQYIRDEPSFSTTLGTIKCQASYVNGSLNVLQPLSFDLTTDSGIMEKTAKWGAYAEAIRRANGESTKTHFIVGAPRLNELQRNFNNAFDYLSEKAGDGFVVSEGDSLKLVDFMASQMAGH
ncbi:MAG: hypothetical protein U5N55_12140 [Cypionkella sp.]|nr:hypothetical protein [Cypionkella sp.]